MARQKLTPPALLDDLATTMPPLPDYLADLVPDPPWPWLLTKVQPQIEQATQPWQDQWLTERKRLLTSLTELKEAWLGHSQVWLEQQLTPEPTGMMTIAQAHLAALSELLQTYIEGVDQKHSETEADLIQIDQRLSQVAETLAEHLTQLPSTPVTMLLRWGWRPLLWLEYGALCQQVQRLGRTFAHLSRARLMTLQSLWLYEEILPFYRDLLADWKQEVTLWEQAYQAIQTARQSPSLTNWSAHLQTCLKQTTGPWTADFVERLYQEATQQYAPTVQAEIGPVNRWVHAQLDNKTLLRLLKEATTPALTTHLTIPVAQALSQQNPDPDALNIWLQALTEQARPFWPFDETTLSEPSASKVG